MMKTKKISKQSLVIAVLSILLVLSMALYAAGAYFTDYAKTDGKGKTLNFGTVKIDAEYQETTTSKTSYDGYVVPGDEFHYTGNIDVSKSTVETYVLIDLQFTLTIGGVVYTELTTEANGDVKVVTVGGAALTLNGWTQVTEGVTGLTATQKLYKVDAGTGPVTYEPSVVISKDCGNVAYNGATAVPLNDTENGTPVAFVLTTSLNVAAMQSKAGGVDVALDTVVTTLQGLLA